MESGGGGGTKELSGRWELKENEKLHLIPQTVVEAFWDDEMGEGEWESRYRYEGDSPLVASAEDIVDGKVGCFLMIVFGKTVDLKRV